MDVRTFEADTIQEAMAMVKRDMGSQALILSTRKLAGSTVGSKAEFNSALIRPPKERFEIKAAAEDAQGALAPGSSVPAAKGSEDCLKSELLGIKELIMRISRSGHLMDGFRANPAVIDIYAKLIRAGIAESHAQSFLSAGGALGADPEATFDAMCGQVLKQVMDTIDVNNPFDYQGKQIVAAFVGPTGVGKTTTCAKLAANLSLKEHLSVGLISVDNYRIGGMEQLKTYAAILGAPCIPVFDSKGLDLALNRMADKNVILIDTAGQSHYDSERLGKLGDLIGRHATIRTHLLLSAVTNEREIAAAAEKFGLLNFSSYIFTKVDETMTRGVIVNQLLNRRAPISFLTTGQRVPEDIVCATKTGVLRTIFQ